jgi:hypothetical protein
MKGSGYEWTPCTRAIGGGHCGIPGRCLAVEPTTKHPGRQFITRQGETIMVTPIAIDMDVPASQPLIPKAQLLDYAEARLVLGPDTDLHPMEPDSEKAVVGREGDRGRRRAFAREPFGDPLADRG